MLDIPTGVMKLMWLTPILLQPLQERPVFSANLARSAILVFDAFSVNATSANGAAASVLRRVVCAGGCDSGHDWRLRIEPHHLNDAFYQVINVCPTHPSTLPT